MQGEFANVNWIAVIVGTVAAFLFGWLWYGKLFGRRWAEGSGISPEPPKEFPVLAMGSQVVALLALATTVGVTATVDMLITAIIAILAAALFAVSGGAFINKSGFALAVDGGYIILAGAIMIICQGLF